MAKKAKKRSGGPRLSESQRYQPGKPSGVVTPVRQAETVSTLPANTDLVEEYRYVLTDLKKIGWLALAMLTLLVVLAFILV
ncbi:MAG TPA: hypothetical protein PLH19_06040 [Anaerolineae bacterium]|nr:hypothetical protein [Anaerolineae bacterium]HQH38081.1 hypothetical protein [Anaerolineae bacterium]